MLDSYVGDGVLDLKRLEEELFDEAYMDSAFDYGWSLDSELDYDNARWTWEREGLFEQFLREHLEDEGCKEWNDGEQNGQFVWIREFDLLMVRPGSDAVPDATLSFNRLGIDDIEFATGVVRGGLFYPHKTATKVVV
jgi:hypothetical protein